MKNNLREIVWKINSYISELKMNYNGTLEDIELTSVDAVAEELSKNIKPGEIQKAMVNMYFAGKLCK